MELNELKLISASNIISLRTAAGLTQAELGAKLNYSDKSVSKWERGEALPDTDNLITIAKLFKTSLDWLIDNDVATNLNENSKDVVNYLLTINVDVHENLHATNFHAEEISEEEFYEIN